MRNNSFNIHDELFIVRYGQGIKLISQIKSSGLANNISVSDIMKMPFMVYFFATDNTTLRINEATAEAFQMLSPSDAVGKTIHDFSKEESARISVLNNNTVVDTGQFIIRDESYILLDDISMETISFKFPWYDSNNRCMGIFGYTFVTGNAIKCSLADCFSSLITTGLFPTTSHFHETLFTNPLFTRREMDVLEYLAQGRTAKEIARMLNLTPRTVEYYIANMKLKSNAHSKSELLDLAFHGYLPQKK